MLTINTGILYVGNVDTGVALAKAGEAHGWIVHLPAETMEALAYHVFYYPDIVVIDRSPFPIMAAEVEHHLRSLCDGTIILTVQGLDVPALVARINAAIEEATHLSSGTPAR